MTNQTPESVIAEVIEYHADAIGSHYDGCYKRHAVCLAVKLRDMLREPGVPDAATEELARIKPLFENYSREYPNECNKRVKAEAERDAALAALERVRVLAVQWNDTPDYQPSEYDKGRVDQRHAMTEQFLAALDGAPEPEVKGLPETGLEMRDSDGDLIMSGEHRKVLHQGMYVCDTCVNDLGLNVRWDRAGFMEGHPLPVEGESKP